ncbi:hypothetical protein, partial [Pseudomonas putida]|uniref:hypothetical protein n=1 Tax=Pseudomonas putida TaxID=303 RepID=UPI001C2DEC98
STGGTGSGAANGRIAHASSLLREQSFQTKRVERPVPVQITTGRELAEANAVGNIFLVLEDEKNVPLVKAQATDNGSISPSWSRLKV